MLEIIYEDEDLIAINKPHGLLVHPSPIARNASTFALHQLRDQVGYRVYPVHRLDRKTSGVLLFAKSPDALKKMQSFFQTKEIKKTYHAIVRGYVKCSGTIDYPLRNDRGKIQESTTHYRSLKHFEIPYPSAGHDTSRYSLVELCPETGRFHQLRKHMAHIFHPIIGDRPHGCNKQNRLWKHELMISEMLLIALELKLEGMEGEALAIQAPYSPVFQEALNLLEKLSLK